YPAVVFRAPAGPRGVPLPSAVAHPYSQLESPFRALWSVMSSQRHAAGMHVQEGGVYGIVQAEDREPDPVEFGKRDGPDGAAVASQRPPRLPPVVVREHAEPWFGQLAGGRGSDAVAGDVQFRAQRGELAGDRAEREQVTARLQRRYNLTEPVGGVGDRSWP